MKSTKVEGRSKSSAGGRPNFGPKRNSHTAFKSKALTRKEKRKEMRKSKKSKRQHFALKKAGKLDQSELQENKGAGSKPKKKKNKNTKDSKPKAETSSGTRQDKMIANFRKEELELKKDMELVRKKRLLEENEEEERTIRQLEKRLKLNKKAIIPASFRTDGLDCKLLMNQLVLSWVLLCNESKSNVAIFIYL